MFGRLVLVCGRFNKIWIQITLVLVFILSRYWFKSIIRVSLPPLGLFLAIFRGFALRRMDTNTFSGVFCLKTDHFWAKTVEIDHFYWDLETGLLIVENDALILQLAYFRLSDPFGGSAAYFLGHHYPPTGGSGGVLTVIFKAQTKAEIHSQGESQLISH